MQRRMVYASDARFSLGQGVTGCPCSTNAVGTSCVALTRTRNGTSAGTSGAQESWTEYKNSRFGYSLSLPASLVVSNRAADGSGVTWQTGTVRVQVSGTNNPYGIKPHEYFSGVKGAAGGRVVEEEHGSDSSGYWYDGEHSRSKLQRALRPPASVISSAAQLAMASHQS